MVDNQSTALALCVLRCHLLHHCPGDLVSCVLTQKEKRASNNLFTGMFVIKIQLYRALAISVIDLITVFLFIASVFDTSQISVWFS